MLYPASPHGVARLEFFDHKGSSSGAGRGGSRRLDCKVIRLAECVSVAPVAVESPPEPGAIAFRLDTAQRSHLLAADAPSSAAWVQTLCLNAFPKGSRPLAPAENPPKLSALEMLENSLYSPTWEGSQFWVTVQRTEAAERCGLHGSYVLRVETERLALLTVGAQSQILEPLLSWPYTLLRRYGRDKVMFSFEAGRRCPSGPGTFTFQTAQGNDIFQAVETAIQLQKTQGKAGQGQDVLRADSQEEVAEGKLASLPGTQELPDSLPALYAEPLDSLRIPPGPSQDSLYSDPLDSTPAQAGEEAQSKKTIYWDLYEHVQQQLLKTKLRDPKEDPIYDEPEGRAPAALRGLYDLPQEPKDAWWCQARAKEEGYELPYNPATDDYAVPPPRSTKPLPAPKPQGLAFPESGAATGSGSKGHSLPDTALYSQVQKNRASGSWDYGLPRMGADRTGVKSEGST